LQRDEFTLMSIGFAQRVAACNGGSAAMRALLRGGPQSNPDNGRSRI